jgi:hypothetical protein
MTDIDTFAVDTLINDYYGAANQIGWKLYNRKEPIRIDELNDLTKLIVQALDDAYEDGRLNGDW